MEWINADDRLPENTETVLMYTGWIRLGHYVKDTERWWESMDEFPVDIKVTHWMPLPVPPGGKVESL